MENVADIMNAEHGVDLNKVNVHNWFKSGTQDYLRHQEFCTRSAPFAKAPATCSIKVRFLSCIEVANQLSVLQIFKTLRDDTLADDHVNRIRSMNALSRLSREALVFKKYEDALAKELREQQQKEQELALKQGVANAPSKEELDRQLLDKSDDFFGFKSAARLRQEWATAAELRNADLNAVRQDSAVSQASSLPGANSAALPSIENRQSKLESATEPRQVLECGAPAPLSAAATDPAPSPIPAPRENDAQAHAQPHSELELPSSLPSPGRTIRPSSLPAGSGVEELNSQRHPRFVSHP